MENIEPLNTKKTIAAHCLLLSMVPENTGDLDKDWLSLAESHPADLESALVSAISWDEIKKCSGLNVTHQFSS